MNHFISKTRSCTEGEQRLIIRQIERRFGEIDSSLIERVRQLSIEQLEALLYFSAISDQDAWLNQQEV